MASSPAGADFCLGLGALAGGGRDAVIGQARSLRAATAANVPGSGLGAVLASPVMRKKLRKAASLFGPH
jgi:hypothetical protein